MTLFSNADHTPCIDQKAICIVSYPVYYHSYPEILGNITALGVCFSGVSGSCVIPSLVISASPLIPGGICPDYLFPLFISLGIF